MLFNPYKVHLTILQQEGYSVSRFLKWWLGHPTIFILSSKKPLVVTPKVRSLALLSIFFYLTLAICFLNSKQYLFLTLATFTLIFLPFIYLSLAILFVAPYEKINRLRVKNNTRKLLQNNPHLKVIGITGSFGKTSVKDILFTILNSFQPTIKTPESYNTIMGIVRVVQMELISKTRFFVCEMGAYVRGEIAEICNVVVPEYAILTAIGSQHLERFKTLKNTTLAKFELIDAVKPQNALVNIDNSLIKKHLSLPQYKKVKTYSLSDSRADFYVSKYLLTPQGVSFQLRYQSKNIAFSSTLFGTSNLYNLVAAISQSLLLHVPVSAIQKAVSSLSPSPPRLELKKINQATLIDNAFSSNEEGLVAIIQDLKKLKGKKVFITPGIVELGSQTATVHRKIGKLASSVFDQIILVGRSDRTKNLEEGINQTNKIIYIENSTNLWPLITKLSQKYDWILLENDLPDNY